MPKLREFCNGIETFGGGGEGGVTTVETCVYKTANIKGKALQVA